MKIPLIERRIRACLPIIRLMQRCIPLSIANWFIKQGLAHVKLDAETICEPVNADGVPCEWIIPRNNSVNHVLLYLHGGGFVFRLTPLHIKMGEYLAQKIGARILMVDYRTSPEYPFPAALDDCVTTYLWLMKQGTSAQNIVIAGDSAGGNLTITLLMKLRDKGIALPAAAACLSPVTSLVVKDNPSEDFKDPLISSKSAKFYFQSYVGKNDNHHPLISPVFGNMHCLPPLLVHAGENETLREDAINITELAKAAGVDVRLEIYPRMWHVWQLYLSLPQAIHSLDDIANFFKEHLTIDTK